MVALLQPRERHELEPMKEPEHRKEHRDGSSVRIDKSDVPRAWKAGCRKGAFASCQDQP